jgi:molybdopterin converting factor subunit 1
MQIKVLFFAQMREAFGAAAHEVEIRKGATLKELILHVLESPALMPFRKVPLMFAVNAETVAEDYVLSDGDEVAVLPPTSGG